MKNNSPQKHAAIFVRTAKALHINHEVDRCKWFTPQEARENIRPNSLAAEFLNAYLDEVGNKPMEMRSVTEPRDF